MSSFLPSCVTRLLVFLCLLTVGNAASAYTLRGSVLDAAADGEPLIQASVRVLKAGASDTTLVKGAVTDSRGRFAISGINAGTYLVEASYVGCATQVRDVKVNGDLTLEPFRLSESAIALREAVVTGIRTPVKVMEDTVEFAAESYRTQPNAVVEDLLKRLPGVEVSSDGSITSNGKKVSKILVDGKEFFSDDPTVASRNLPVNMVERVQVVDRKSDLARITGVDDGEEETVINLTVKKDMKNGWFGNIEGGYGTDERYNGSFTINRFWNNNQITFLGAANNVNQPTFSDGANGRFRRFGGLNGITAAQALGLNFNVGNDEIFRVGGDVMYSHTDRNTITERERVYTFTDSSSYENANSAARDKGHNVRGDFRIQWKPDSLNTFDFRPNFSFNFNKSTSADSTRTFAGREGRPEVTRSVNLGSSSGSSYEFGANMIYNHRFRSRPGRSFSVQARYRFSNVREKSDSYSWNRFFQLMDSVDLYDQWADNHTWSNQINGRLSWTEPLGDVRKGNFLTFAYSANYRWNNADKLTYDHPVDWVDGTPGFGDYVIDPELVFNTELSNQYRNHYFNQDIRLGYKHTSRSSNLDAGVSLVPQMSESIDLLDERRNISRWVWNVAPFLRYRLRLTKSRSFNANYRGRSSQPSISQLQPVADVSNPLNIVQGNPALKPTFTHYLNLRFQDFNQEAQRSIMAMVFANYEQNSIVSRTEFNPETSGRFTTYENVNGVWSIRGMNMVSFPLRNKTFTFNNHLFLEYSRSVGFNNSVRNIAGNFSVGLNPGLAWRPDNLELEIRPSYRLQTTHNSVQMGNNRTIHTYGGTFYASWYTPWGLVLGSDLDYSATSGYSAGYDSRSWLWNASLSYQFLRDKSATVTVKGYDILGQRSNIRRTTTGNYYEDSRYNSLTRYVMVTVAYKFNTFGKGGTPQDRNAPNFDGPGHGGPGNGRPSGPPPGMPRPPMR